MSVRKVTTRRIAIVLGILCVALSIALVFAVNEANMLRDIVNLNQSQVWLDHEQVMFQSYAEKNFDYRANYSGYVMVQFESASPTIYIEVSYDRQHPLDLLYDRRMNISAEGNFTFPVLPSVVRIAVGNLADTQGSVIVRVTYVY